MFFLLRNSPKDLYAYVRHQIVITEMQIMYFQASLGHDELKVGVYRCLLETHLYTVIIALV